VTWGNYAAIAPASHPALRIESGDVVAIEKGQSVSRSPCMCSPVQSANTISLAVGYGRTHVGRVGEGVGENVYPLARLIAGTRRYFRTGVKMTRTGRSTRSRHADPSFDGRADDRQAETLADFVESPASRHETQPELPTLWAERPSSEHRWGMAVDLSACTVARPA